MEGRYTKIGAFVAVIALFITLWQLKKENIASFQGKWEMISEIQSAELSSYEGMKIEWVLNLTQNGRSITGIGEKVKVNGSRLSGDKRTFLNIKGTIIGDRFTLQYGEKGRIRNSSGIFQGRITGKKFQGDFSQTASNSSGVINGNKAD